MDKGTEYFVSFSTKTRAYSLGLLKQFVTLTGRKIRYLRIDDAKKFHSDKIKENCAENDVVLQLVVAYNHTMQARVEGAIGCVKQHSRTSLLHANTTTCHGFWDDSTKDFSIKKVYPWASLDTRGKLRTIACSRLSSAPTQLLLCLLAAEPSLNCPVNTAWSRTDHLVIVSLKVRTSIVTPPHLASGCSA